MPNKRTVTFHDDARKSIQEGVQTVYEAVASTLGPRSANVAIDRQWGVPLVIHDGVTVARELVPLEDKQANLAAQLVVDAAERTNKAVGDATTTTTILTHALYQEALKNVTAGTNGLALRKGIWKGVQAITTLLKGLAKPVKKDEEILQVATISAQNEQIGELVAAAIKKIGPDGVITVEESKTAEMSIEFKEGMEFDQGMLSHYFMTDGSEANLENPYILVTDRKPTPQEFVQFMETWASDQTKETRNIVVIAPLEGEPLAFLVVNKMKGNIGALAVKPPSFGEKQTEMLQDIATLTGGRFVATDTGETLENVGLSDLGRAQSVIATKEQTLIVGGAGDEDLIKLRIEMIQDQLDDAELSPFEREGLEERLAKLSGGIAVLQVGAHTEAAMKERKELAIDAISATKAALAEGIVPGGATTLLRATEVLDEIVGTKEELVGVDIVRQACQAPFRRLMENAGFDPGEMRERVGKAKQGYGVDVTDGALKDLVKAGIIDPVKVLRVSLENAASTALMLISTTVLITQEDDGRESA